MKSNNLIQKTTIASITFLSLMSCNIQAADLQVTIDHINSENGHVMAQVFSSEDNYKKGKAIQNQMFEAKKGAGQLLFEDLSAGEYVVRMFHDENNNQQMDTNAFGMPTEGYGFSNEAVGNMGPPKYKEMIVVIKEEEGVVETKAKMIYL